MDPFKPYEPKPKTVPLTLTVSDAEAVALKAVAWIVSDEEMLSRFSALTGCGADDLRLRIRQPAFLGAVLDFLLGNEQDVIAFAAHEDMPPETPLMARQRLP